MSARVGDAAVEQFNRGYNCAEAILLALAPASDGDAANAGQRAGAAFGAGIARRGLTCGCLTGFAIAVGLRLGRTDPDDLASREAAYQAVGTVLRRFEDAFGTLECRKLTGLDFTEDIPPARKEQVLREVCTPLVRFVAEVGATELMAAERARS